MSEGTIRKAIKEGRLSRPKRIAAGLGASVERTDHASTPRERSDEDAGCAGGVATKREQERALAPTGQLLEAPAHFEAAQSVAKAGVLVALPALLSQGLLEVGQQIYGRLKNGYYGLSTMLLTFGLMALVRIKSAERTHRLRPRGVRAGARPGPGPRDEDATAQARPSWPAAARRWSSRAPSPLVGPKRPPTRWAISTSTVMCVPTMVAPTSCRRPTCNADACGMPATTDYWVNDADAQPLMFVTAPANDGLLAMMEDELLPEIRQLAGEDAPSDTDLRPRGVEPEALQEVEE